MRAENYPLPSPWTLRAHAASEDQTVYKSNHFAVMDLETIADWVRLAQSLQPGAVFASPQLQFVARKLPVATFSLFRGAVRPEWEDPVNATGFTCSLRGALSAEQIDALWSALVLEAVRGGFPAGVVGLQLTRKQGKRSGAVKFDVWASSRGRVVEVLSHLNEMHALQQKFVMVDRMSV